MPATSSLGSYQFLKLSGNPVAAKKRIQVVERPGIDGFQAWDTGARGPEFVLEGTVDQPSTNTAQELMTTYRTAIGTTLPLFWEGPFFSDCLVIDVRQVRIQKLAASTGGIAGGAALIVSAWTLRAT